MFGRHYQQLNEQRCPVNLPRETLNNISLTRGFPQYLFPFPRVTLTFCSLNRGISRGKPRQNRGKISMQVSSADIRQVWRSLALQTTVDSHAEFVVDSLRYIQPVQFV